MVVVPTFGGNPEPQDDIRVIIKDLESKPKFMLALPSSTTVAQLYQAVSAKRKYPAVRNGERKEVEISVHVLACCK